MAPHNLIDNNPIALGLSLGLFPQRPRGPSYQGLLGGHSWLLAVLGNDRGTPPALPMLRRSRKGSMCWPPQESVAGWTDSKGSWPAPSTQPR